MLVDMRKIGNQVLVHDVASDHELVGYGFAKLMNERKNTNQKEFIDNIYCREVYRSRGIVLDEELEKTRYSHEYLCGHQFIGIELP